MAARSLRWATLIFDFEPVQGHEQGGERRALVVSYEPLHSSGMVTVCPITAARSQPRYPNEVPIPRGDGDQTTDALILCHQVRTVSITRVTGRTPTLLGYVTDPQTRAAVRAALAVQLGLDLDGFADGAGAAASYR